MHKICGEVIHGDNVEVLNSLIEAKTTIKCAYIDPPYNNGDKISHYNDNANFDEWLQDLTSVCGKIRELLSEDGSLWISIDDKNMHYLKVALDGIFGRENFVTTIVWEHRTSRENRATFSENHEYILVYARSAIQFKKTRNPLPYTAEWAARFRNPDNDPRGPWQSVSVTAQEGHATKNQFYQLITPTGRRLLPPKGRCWAYPRPKLEHLIIDGRVYFGKEGKGVPRLKKFISEMSGGLTPHTIWTAEEVGTTACAKKHLIQLLKSEAVFETPKPESLVARILQIASNPGDLVLDAYLGSGTTASVAHKMGRRYIGIEIGSHALTHCSARLDLVREGEQGGISESEGWFGGGRFVLRNARAA